VHRATDTDRWLRGMSRLQRLIDDETGQTQETQPQGKQPQQTEEPA
jgi:hypothetical protein